MSSQGLTRASEGTPAFPEHLQAALQRFRASIIELLSAIDADPAKPQDLARRFGLNKNLTWKISKVVNGPDLYSSVPHIPGSGGMRIFFSALTKAGAPAPLVEEARKAADEFDRVVEVHTGDRTTLEIMTTGMQPPSVQAEQHEQSRKLAYQGNSGTWGVRAKTQLALNILTTNADDPTMADLVQIGGLIGFRRLRADARWLLFRRERWSDDDPQPAQDVMESLDPAFPAEQGIPLMGDFCSAPVPDIDLLSGTGEDQYELPPGPVGNTAAFTCIYGQVSRQVGGLYGETPGEVSEIGCNLITPAEHLVFDLLVHRELEWAMRPTLVMYSRMDGGTMHAPARRTRNLLPVAEQVHDAGWGVTALATPLVPSYSGLVRYTFDRLGWNADEFRAFRFTMAYPPIPTAALMRSELPVRA
jgi:hypothetical protein